jgi:tetratricopeptide (TPR) repeat protein
MARQQTLRRFYYRSGVGSLGKDDYDKAISDFTEAIRLSPNYGHAYNNRGNAYCGQRNFDKAISDYTEAIRLNPNNALAYYNRGVAYWSQRKLRQGDQRF